MKTLSAWAKVAKNVRTHLKANSIKAKVRATSYSMGSRVDVEIADMTWEQRDAIQTTLRDMESDYTNHSGFIFVNQA